MNRRTFIKGILGSLTALGTVLISRPGLASKEKRLDAETLKKRLTPRTKEDEKFIEKVVRLRDSKKLSEKSVNAAYTLAMRQKSKRFAYFSTAIKKLAKQENVNL